MIVVCFCFIVSVHCEFSSVPLYNTFNEFNVQITSASLSAYLFGAFTIINVMGTRDIT